MKKIYQQNDFQTGLNGYIVTGWYGTGRTVRQMTASQ